MEIKSGSAGTSIMDPMLGPSRGARKHGSKSPSRLKKDDASSMSSSHREMGHKHDKKLHKLPDPPVMSPGKCRIL